MSSERLRAHEIIDYISDKKISEAVDFLECLLLKDETEATNDILTDEKMFIALKKGIKQASEGEMVDLEDI